MLLDKWAVGFTIRYQAATFTDQPAGESLLPPVGAMAATAENAGGLLDFAGRHARGWRGDRPDVPAKFQALSHLSRCLSRRENTGGSHSNFCPLDFWADL
jgi:hypothetical protein